METAPTPSLQEHRHQDKAPSSSGLTVTHISADAYSAYTSHDHLGQLSPPPFARQKGEGQGGGEDWRGFPPRPLLIAKRRHQCFGVLEMVKHPREFADQFGRYLRVNPVVQLSIRTFLAHLSVAANARPEQVPWPQQFLMPLGRRIARWLPTFLVIDGPLGRFLRAVDSPLNELLRKEHATFPALAQARDIFNHDLFHRVRNGVGHWAFAWEQESDGERLVCFDWESGERRVRAAPVAQPLSEYLADGLGARIISAGKS